MRVLLVEDEPLIGEATREVLEDEAFAVDLATTGSHADELMAVNDYDVAILDWSLPPPTGIELLRRLCDEGLSVSLETSGAIDVSQVDARVSRVVDVKTPGSGEEPRNLWSNLPLLTAHDQLKFVLCGRADYEWARAKITEHAMHERCDVILSPSFGQVDPTELAQWMIDDRIPARMQLQLHKLLWGDARGK